VQFRAAGINGLLAAYSIFAGLLFNLVMLVITFLERTHGDPGNRMLQDRKRLLRELTANVCFTILVALGMVAVGIAALVRMPDDRAAAGRVETALLIAGSANFLLNLLMVLRRMYALIINEFDRHKILKQVS
jgi:hypothetical protein